ncbi:MAG TPA: dTMP kinase [Xanthomonadaceae bacterium]|nr:dTMP kinase [Xanthomonadaceae bacterium]
MSGRLISFEGVEGAGKSTVIAAAETCLRRHGIEPVLVREPGGTSIGERVRALLLDAAVDGMCAETELLLMFASRAQLVAERILPALEKGSWVLADRFTDASFAYQGGGRGLDTAWIAELERRAVGIKPDLSFLLDIGVGEGLARAGERGDSDRIEGEQQAFFESVRAAYLERAAAEPARFCVIDASRTRESVAADVVARVETLVEACA